MSVPYRAGGVTQRRASRRGERCRSLARADGGGLQLAVSDNGAGFNYVRDAGRHSLGHASMRERVHLLGGEVDIESTPGHGTTVIAWVPLQAAPS